MERFFSNSRLACAGRAAIASTIEGYAAYKLTEILMQSMIYNNPIPTLLSAFGLLAIGPRVVMNPIKTVYITSGKADSYYQIADNLAERWSYTTLLLPENKIRDSSRIRER